jgi:hypothetical protein
MVAPKKLVEGIYFNVKKQNGPDGPFCFLCQRDWRRSGCPAAFCSTTLAAALAGVFFVVGGGATLQAAFLAVRGGKTNAFGGDGAGRCFAVSFGTKFLCHGWTPLSG